MVRKGIPLAVHHENAMLVYLKLAVVLHQRGQLAGRDKLLVLTGAEACRAGLLQQAEPCYELIRKNNPRHALSQYDSFLQAMKSEDFQVFLKRTEEHLPFEKAEFLLEEQGVDLNEISQKKDKEWQEEITKSFSEMTD